ncbi:hypothetical protein CPB83DRAFT_891818 [Crepidotus variabilis]|uniref:Uncharacterized protein n=1 Tax=Crepidotus variabilis TaxID=179855 RepID=A0A9P6JS14_9AGAR|nr:hypothetical protein CPB83DRAFT_891818 [Crepidotus variabilis]
MSCFELGSIPLYGAEHKEIKIEEMEVEDMLCDVADEGNKESQLDVDEGVPVFEFKVYDKAKTTMQRRYPRGLPRESTLWGDDVGATENPLAVLLPEDLLNELHDYLPVCCVCEKPIVPSDEEFGNMLFKLSHCGHKLHMGCNFHLAEPFNTQACFAPKVKSKITPRPHPFLVIWQGDKEIKLYNAAVPNLEDADYVQPWVCPEEGCDIVYYSYLKDGVWNNWALQNSNGNVVTYKGKEIGGIRTSYIVKPAVYRFEAPSFQGTTLI